MKLKERKYIWSSVPEDISQYKIQVADLIDYCISHQLYSIVADSFTNAIECDTLQPEEGVLDSTAFLPDSWDGAGYWQFIYTSLESGLDRHWKQEREKWIREGSKQLFNIQGHPDPDITKE